MAYEDPAIRVINYATPVQFRCSKKIQASGIGGNPARLHGDRSRFSGPSGGFLVDREESIACWGEPDGPGPLRWPLPCTGPKIGDIGNLFSVPAHVGPSHLAFDGMLHAIRVPNHKAPQRLFAIWLGPQSWGTSFRPLALENLVPAPVNPATRRP